MKIIDDEDDDSARGIIRRARRRQDDAFVYGGRRGSLRLVDTAAVDECERVELLLDAVFVDLEIVSRQVGLELPAPVADDDVRADEVDRGPEGRVRRVGHCRPGAGSGAAGCCAFGASPKAGTTASKPATSQGANFLVVIVENSRNQYSKGVRGEG